MLNYVRSSILFSRKSCIKDFAIQEFSENFKGSISPLGMVNRWIRSNLIQWNNSRHDYIKDWKRNDEHPQPRRQKIEFKKIVGLPYPGS